MVIVIRLVLRRYSRKQETHRILLLQNRKVASARLGNAAWPLRNATYSSTFSDKLSRHRVITFCFLLSLPEPQSPFRKNDCLTLSLLPKVFSFFLSYNSIVSGEDGRAVKSGSCYRLCRPKLDISRYAQTA